MYSHLFLLLIFLNFINSIRIIDIKFDFKVSEIHRLLNTKRWNCSDVIHYFLDRSHRYNPLLNAIINYNPKAIDEAIELDTYYYQKNQSFVGKLHWLVLKLII
jgi:Asp-tRNA(Asn)/Glu-tRNA(Gln) amidotransferase A subunit family amidase